MIYAYVYLYLYVYLFLYVYLYVNVYVYVYAYVCVYTKNGTFICTYIYIYAHFTSKGGHSINGKKSTASHQFTPASGHLLRGRGALLNPVWLMIGNTWGYQHIGDCHCYNPCSFVCI